MPIEKVTVGGRDLGDILAENDTLRKENEELKTMIDPNNMQAWHRSQAQLKTALEALERNLRDMDRIDELTKMVGVHPFTLMRKEITEAIAAIKEKGDTNDR